MSSEASKPPRMASGGGSGSPCWRASRVPDRRADRRRAALSGGYAGAKATQRFITAYAQDEAERAGLDITFTTVLPRMTPLTDLGRSAVEAYAARAGQSFEDYLEQLAPPVTPEIAGAAVIELVRADTAQLNPAYMLSGAELQRLP